jgi:drug/metabolite transporter (DMT)-like permease
MTWYFYSIFAALSLAGMVLCTRFLGNKGFSSKQILIFMLGLNALSFLMLLIPTFNTFINSANLSIFLVIIAIAGILSYIGNVADFTAVIKAPNPGFADAIKSSNILLTLLLSMLLFHSQFSFGKLLGAVFIIIGIALLVVDKKSALKNEKTSSSWKILAVTAAICFSIVTLFMKKLTQLNFGALEIGLFTSGIAFIFTLVSGRKEIRDCFADKEKTKIFLPIVFLASIFSLVAGIFNVKGIALSPNPGYHDAIRNSRILFATLISVPLLGAAMDKKKFLGVLIILIGMAILVI